MSTLYGVNATKALTPSAAYILDQGCYHGRVRCMLDYYSMASMTGTSDVLYLGSALPQGAKILKIQLGVTAAQSSLTFKLGTVYNDDEFQAASCTDLQTAGDYYYEGKQYAVGTVATDEQIILTNAGAAGSAATLYCCIYYVMD